MLSVNLVLYKPTPESCTHFKEIQYSNFKLTICNDAKNISEWYNEEFLKEPRFDVYGFLKHNDQFTSTDALKNIVDVFESDPQSVGIVYTDKYLSKGKNHIYQIYPPFEIKSKFIYNPTIFVNGGIKATLFDPNLSSLRNYDVIQKVSTGCKIIHIPEPLINSDFELENIDDELKYYVGQNS